MITAKKCKLLRPLRGVGSCLYEPEAGGLHRLKNEIPVLSSKTWLLFFGGSVHYGFQKRRVYGNEPFLFAAIGENNGWCWMNPNFAKVFENRYQSCHCER